MTTFWLVGTSVSKCLLCTIQKKNFNKIRQCETELERDNTSPLVLPSESFCSMSTLDNHDLGQP